jgi:diaminopimelate epimerase
MLIPYTKAHGSKNDFLLTWASALPTGLDDGALKRLAQAICDRYTGVGADGWLVVTEGPGKETDSIRLINSDGSDSEMSGNGTRCAAAFLMESVREGNEITIRTGAGPKDLRVVERAGRRFVFEMDMGTARYSKDELDVTLTILGVPLTAAILNVGNPQCAVMVEDFQLDWRKLGKAIEWHERFPNRTNVSFVRVVDRHAIEVRFWERGAGETMSSGTGSTGAAFAALLRGAVDSPVEVRTPAGALHLRLAGEGSGGGNNMILTGPAELVARGDFFWSERDKTES